MTVRELINKLIDLQSPNTIVLFCEEESMGAGKIEDLEALTPETCKWNEDGYYLHNKSGTRVMPEELWGVLLYRQ